MKTTVTFIFLLIVFSCSIDEVQIGIQPYNDFDHRLIDTVINVLENTYKTKIEVLPSLGIPDNEFVKIKTPRYRADSLLIDLKSNKPDTVKYILGLTNKDISTTIRTKAALVKEPEWKYNDWGVFGLAYRPGPSAIVSTFRLKHGKEDIFISRLKKVSIHELGHNFGLAHCQTLKCVMQDAAESIKTVDSVGMELCNDCRQKLQ